MDAPSNKRSGSARPNVLPPLLKLAALSAAIAQALRQRGLDEPRATLTAETAIAMFKTAFERWIDTDELKDFPQLVRRRSSS